MYYTRLYYTILYYNVLYYLWGGYREDERRNAMQLLDMRVQQTLAKELDLGALMIRRGYIIAWYIRIALYSRV